MLVVFDFSLIFYMASDSLGFPYIHMFALGSFLRCLITSSVFACLRAGDSKTTGSSGSETQASPPLPIWAVASERLRWQCTQVVLLGKIPMKTPVSCLKDTGFISHNLGATERKKGGKGREEESQHPVMRPLHPLISLWYLCPALHLPDFLPQRQRVNPQAFSVVEERCSPGCWNRGEDRGLMSDQSSLSRCPPSPPPESLRDPVV